MREVVRFLKDPFHGPSSVALRVSCRIVNQYHVTYSNYAFKSTGGVGLPVLRGLRGKSPVPHLSPSRGSSVQVRSTYTNIHYLVQTMTSDIRLILSVVNENGHACRQNVLGGTAALPSVSTQTYTPVSATLLIICF